MRTDQTTDITEISRTCVLKILNTTNTICGENCDSSWFQVILRTKEYKCIIS
jgi:hypothetical protein